MITPKLFGARTICAVELVDCTRGLTLGNCTYLSSALASLDSSRAALAVLLATITVIAARPATLAPVTRPNGAEAADASEHATVSGRTFVAYVRVVEIAIALRFLQACRVALVADAESVNARSSVASHEAALLAVSHRGAR